MCVSTHVKLLPAFCIEILTYRLAEKNRRSLGTILFRKCFHIFFRKQNSTLTMLNTMQYCFRMSEQNFDLTG